MTYDDIFKNIDTLDIIKETQQSDILTKNLKQNSHYFAETFYKNINQYFFKINNPIGFEIS